MKKDLFSGHSDSYRKYRPTYPNELYEYLASLCRNREAAWDVGTGNGQAAVGLAQYFDHVIATDLSQNQVDQAIPHPRVEYRVAQAESSGLESGSVDLITTAQAAHWFDADRFHAEAKRVARPTGAIIARWCYGLATITPEVDVVVRDFYARSLAAYWEPERVHVDQKYSRIPFPFERIHPPQFEIQVDWSLEHWLGYLATWSAVQAAQRATGGNPLIGVQALIARAWGSAATRKVRWEITLHVGRI